VAGESRILTVPNLITLARLACVPVFLYLLFGTHPTRRMAAAYLLGALGATDWVDGYVARHFHQVSDLGKVLDPVADRLLLLVGVVAITIDGSAPPVVAALTIFREGVVAIAGLTLAALGAKRIDVTWAGKAGTFGLLFAWPLFLLSASDAPLADVAWVVAWLFAVPGLFFSYVSAAAYVPLAREALRAGRVGSGR
jgi:cardiolipin synthase (CMP-forming)